MTYSTNPVVQKLYELAIEAWKFEDELCPGSPEPYYEAALQHVLAHPEFKPEFIEAFIRLIYFPFMSPGLHLFCIHALRWDELKSELTERMKSEASERARHILRGLLSACEDDWDDGGFYERFKQGKKPRGQV